MIFSLEFILPVLIVTVFVGVLLPILFRNKEKVDKGRALVYYKLSYRRKMIRTLTTIPLLIIIILAASYLADLDTVEILLFSSVFVVMTIIQFFYNYFKWKKLERE
ncbi:ATPase [Rossellomorea vietnamensis]|uniref:ATPase n=1 Tax=Rossellomorea vietnamensis TaxID=218284 RepID=UPI003CF61FC3